MARTSNKLTARGVASLTKPGRHSDGSGLYLSIDGKGGRRWVLLFTWQGRMREMGLGSGSTVSLARARELAADARRLVVEGRDRLRGDAATRLTSPASGRWPMISWRASKTAGAIRSTAPSGR